MESLERRCLLDAVIFDGFLRVTGATGNDDIVVSRQGVNQVVATLNGQMSVFDAGDITDRLIVISGSDGNDRITLGDGLETLELRVHLSGGFGNDWIAGAGTRDTILGHDGNDTLIGNGGDDDINGVRGNDSINGGSGNDTLSGDVGNDTVVTGAGFDAASGGDGNDSVVGDANEDVLFAGENPGGDDGSVTVDGAGILRVQGSPRVDRITVLQIESDRLLVTYNNVIKSLPAAVGIRADLGAGNDWFDLHLQSGDVISIPATIFAGAGDDDVLGGFGADFISGGDGDDELQGWHGNDTISGEDGNDHLEDAGGDDALSGGNGNDLLNGGPGGDTLAGGAGLNFFTDGETVSGASYPPTLSIDNLGMLHFDGTDAHERVALWANAARDFIVWIDGATYLVYREWAHGGFAFAGNGGNDVCRVDAALDVRTDMNGGLGNDTLVGGAGADRMIENNPGNDRLLGNGGSDTLAGGDGDDTLDGGAGADRMLGGGGRDTADYSSRTAPLLINQADDDNPTDGELREADHVAEDIERVLGGSGNDRFIGNHLNNAYLGGDGNDTMSGAGGADALQGQGGHDVIVGGAGNDYLDGGALNDSIYGQGGNDVLLGQGNNDHLFANDNLRDTVNGGFENDRAAVDDLDIVTSVETRV
jgi:Ca2+-binding RTX toxin-like protein